MSESIGSPGCCPGVGGVVSVTAPSPSPAGTGCRTAREVPPGLQVIRPVSGTACCSVPLSSPYRFSDEYSGAEQFLPVQPVLGCTVYWVHTHSLSFRAFVAGAGSCNLSYRFLHHGSPPSLKQGLLSRLVLLHLGRFLPSPPILLLWQVGWSGDGREGDGQSQSPEPSWLTHLLSCRQYLYRRRMTGKVFIPVIL